MKKRNSLLINTFYNAAYNGMNVLFPLITIPYLSRVLLADGIGKVNYATNIVSWFLMFASLGIPRYGVREVAKVRDSKGKLNHIFTELFLINFCSTVFCSIVYIFIIFFYPYFEKKQLLYLMVGMQLFLNVFNVDWFYQGLEEYGYITKRSLIVKSLSIVAIFSFVHTKSDYIIYASIQSVALAGNYIFNMSNIFKYVSFSVKGIHIYKHVLPIVVLLSTQFAVNIYALLDTTMLGWWSSDNVIGYYSNSQKIIKTIAVFTASLGGVLLPHLVQYIRDSQYDKLREISNKILGIILYICIPITLGLFFLADDLVLVLFGKDFIPAIETMRIFAPFIIFTTVGNLYGTQLLMSLGEEKKLLISVVIGAVINFLLNYILIRLYYQNGAAFASVITEFIVMILQIKFVAPYMRLHIGSKTAKNILIENITMCMAVILVKRIVSNSVAVLAFGTLFGTTIYVLVSAIRKDAIAEDIIKRVSQSK
ncbi:flippase [Faecalibaculum rodentium]|uniref:Uncharacterized protein n=1 Tax=Faecalibaculum rodentium TaxID=1702221 RepID=A0A1Q9YHV3_9FIRM|nr:flippase [Faecalibaculum rodentium]OLU43731.1 hypothetical protein BO223_10940 [Faecalibaculum rodentium]